MIENLTTAAYEGMLKQAASCCVYGETFTILDNTPFIIINDKLINLTTQPNYKHKEEDVKRIIELYKKGKLSEELQELMDEYLHNLMG